MFNLNDYSMKNYFLLFGFILSFMFVSCSDDDHDGGSSSGGKIVGTWSMDMVNGFVSSGYNQNEFAFFQFQKDGTYINVDNIDGDSDIELEFGTYKLSGNKVIITVNHTLGGQEVSEAEYRVSDNKLYLSMPVAGVLTTFVYTYVDDSVLDKYFIKHNLKDYIKQHEVNLDQYKVNVDQYKVNLDQYKVNLDQYKVDLKPNMVTGLSCPDNKHPHAIDMGEAGMWACCNVGASKPTDFGSYFSWGETEAKDYYDYYTYKYYDYTKGFINIGDDIAGTSYDVAHVKWGGKWIIPSLEKIKALLNNTTIEDILLYDKGENLDNCYLINGKTYRIDNITGYCIINNVVYDFNSVDIKDYYLIDGKTYNIPADDDYYLLNNKIYKLDTYNYYFINGKTCEIDNINDLYIMGNNLYEIPDHLLVDGIDRFSSVAQFLTGLWINRFNKIKKNLDNYKINNNSLLGRKFISKNGNVIFLPSAGFIRNYGPIYVGEYGSYWSSNNSDGDGAYYFSFHDGKSSFALLFCYDGRPVRPVME